MITKHAASRTLLIHPQAVFDALNVARYQEQTRAFLAEGYDHLILDLAGTEYINSSAIGWMVEVCQIARRQNGSFKMINASESIQALLRQTKLDKLLLDEPPAGGVPEMESLANWDRLHEMMAAEICLLTQVNQAVARALKLDTVPKITAELLQGALEMSRAEFGCLLLMDEKRRQFKLAQQAAASDKRSVRAPAGQTFFPCHAGRLESQIMQGEDVFFQDLSKLDSGHARLFLDLGFEQLFAAPIRGAGQCFGVLALEATSQTRELLLAAKPILIAFTQVCGQTIENASLTARLKDRNEELNRALERLRISHQSLINAGRLAAMGTALSGIGHQLNNKLTPMVGNCQLLARHKSKMPPEALKNVEMIASAGNQIREAIEKLVCLAQTRPPLAASMNAHDCIRIAFDLLRAPIDEQQVRLEIDLSGDPPCLSDDPDLLLQALLALLHRACTSYSPEQTLRWLRVAAVAGEGGFQIMIEDNGAPISEEEANEQIDPLLSLEDLSRGLIFSYNTPRSFIRRLGGALSVANRQEGGKKVVITLPQG